jgi:tetratricopeptide (TPR) repeat protein
MTTELKEQIKLEEETLSIVQIHELIHEMEKQLKPEESIDAKFQLASLYTRSRTPKYIHKGIAYFQEVLKAQDISLELRRDCLYMISRAFYSLEEFVESKKWVDHLLELDPNHTQAKRFKALLEEIVFNDAMLGYATVGVLGVATVSGLAALGVLGGFLLLRKK